MKSCIKTLLIILSINQCFASSTEPKVYENCKIKILYKNKVESSCGTFRTYPEFKLKKYKRYDFNVLKSTIIQIRSHNWYE